VGARAKNPRTPPSVPERRKRERERERERGSRAMIGGPPGRGSFLRQAFLARLRLDDRSWIAARSRILSLHFAGQRSVMRRCETRSASVSEKASWRNDNVDTRGANLIPMLSTRYTRATVFIAGVFIDTAPLERPREFNREFKRVRLPEKRDDSSRIRAHALKAPRPASSHFREDHARLEGALARGHHEEISAAVNSASTIAIRYGRWRESVVESPPRRIRCIPRLGTLTPEGRERGAIN